MYKLKLAIVISHPIQHFCPLYANWAKYSEWQIKVFFATNSGAKPYFDEHFQKMVTWDGLRLDEFDHIYLNETERIINAQLDSENLETALKEFNPDAVLIYGYAQKLQRRAKKWALANRKKLFYFADSELHQHRPWYKIWIKKFYLSGYFKSIDHFLVTGNANEYYYRYHGAPSRKYIRSSYPIDLEAYENAWQKRLVLRETIRKKHQIPDTHFVVSMAGKLIDRKRQIDLIEALRHINSVEITLLLMGTGEQMDLWQQRAAEIKGHQIVFAGFIESVELPAYYAASDLYAHASIAEPHSVAISEAIYMGCPVILSDRCGSYGIDDDVQIGINGFTFPVGDTRRIAQLIEYLVKNPEKRLEMSVHSHEIAAKNQRNTYYHIPETLKTILQADA